MIELSCFIVIGLLLAKIEVMFFGYLKKRNAFMSQSVYGE
jgi:hypothetical protein